MATRFLIGDRVVCRYEGRPLHGIVSDDAVDGLYPIRVTTGQIMLPAADLAHEPQPVPNTTHGQIWVNEDGEVFVVTAPADGWLADGLSHIWLGGDAGRLVPLSWGDAYGTRHQLDSEGWYLYEGLPADQLRPGDQIIGVIDPRTQAAFNPEAVDDADTAEPVVSYIQPGLGVTAVRFTDQTTVDIYDPGVRFAVVDTSSQDPDAPTGWAAFAEGIGA